MCARCDLGFLLHFVHGVCAACVPRRPPGWTAQLPSDRPVGPGTREHRRWHARHKSVCSLRPAPAEGSASPIGPAMPRAILGYARGRILPWCGHSPPPLLGGSSSRVLMEPTPGIARDARRTEPVQDTPDNTMPAMPAAVTTRGTSPPVQRTLTWQPRGAEIAGRSRGGTIQSG